MKTEQERGDWENLWPQEGDQCPDCLHGLIETQEFGKGAGAEIWAWCAGLNGSPRAADGEEEADGDGCGWSGRYAGEGPIKGRRL